MVDVTEQLTRGATHAVSQLLNPAERLYWLYLLTALALAGIAYFGSAERSQGTGFLRYVFPRNVWLHRSAILDYFFVGLTTVLWASLVAPHLPDARAVQAWLTNLADQWTMPAADPLEPTVAIATLYTVTLVMVDDFRRYLLHRLFHAVPLLWEFHKVHHSARVLTPITVYREHPVEMLANSLAAALTVGLVTAVFLHLFPGGLLLLTVLGVNAARFVFDLFGSNLRHSHIWLRFGRTLEHVLISPAQHQIHHSSDARHHDRNFGSQLAIWDWAFGTLYVPANREFLVFGLGQREDDRLSTLTALYLRPFRAAFEILVSNRRNSQSLESGPA